MKKKKKEDFSLGAVISPELAIDLGTLNTVIYMKGRGIILREPSIIAVDERTEEIIAVGKEAKEMKGRNSKNIKLISPIKSGVVADSEVASSMLKAFIKKSSKHKFSPKTKMVFPFPSGATEVEKSAVHDVGVHSGGSEVNILDAPIAALIAEGIYPSTAKSQMIMIMGAGHTDVAVCSYGEILASSYSRIGGLDVDEAIIRYVKKKYKLVISENTAETIKIKIGSLFPLENDYQNFMEVKGRGLNDNLPKSVAIQAEEIRGCISEPFSDIVKTIVDTCEKLPPQVSADILEKGIIVTGGASLLSGVREFIKEKIGFDVKLAQHPFDSVAEGLGSIYKTDN